MADDQEFLDQDRPAPRDRPVMNPRSPRQAIMPERMPPPPSRRARHPLVVAGNAIFTFLVLLIIAGGIALFVGKERFEAPGPLDRERTVNIPRATGIRAIAETLRREGVIDHPLLFVAGAVTKRATGNLKAGEYLFDRHISMSDVLDTMIEGRVVQHQVTIAEGLTSQQIVDRLRESDVLTGEIADLPPEGSMLPESYNVTRGMTRQQLVARMRAAHDRVLQDVWERRAPDLPLKTPEALVTLASIVEKETGRADERTRVAAVFINRLNRRMRLQSDPTIIYGIAGGKGSLGRPIQRDEISKPTAYNTYVINGLPPGPIANPGRASLEAVANPSRTKELYFVADGSGGHVFAETYDQHRRNVSRWRAFQKEQATAAAQEEQAPEETAPPENEARGDAEDSQPRAGAKSNSSRTR